MAKDKDKKKDKKKKPSATKYTLLWSAIFASAVIMLPTTLLVSFGMMPSVAAWVVDRRPQKYTAITVSIMNLCGVVPFLFDMWATEHTIPYALSVLRNPMAWLVMYGVAALGWMLTRSMPALLSLTLNVQREDKLKKLNKKKQKLIDEWGTSITELPKEEEA